MTLVCDLFIKNTNTSSVASNANQNHQLTVPSDEITITEKGWLFKVEAIKKTKHLGVAATADIQWARQ